jgi:hypothetical protein
MFSPYPKMVATLEESSSSFCSPAFNPDSTPSVFNPHLGSDSTNHHRRCVVALTWTIYEAAFDAYFCMDMGDAAFSLYNFILHDSDEDSGAKKSLTIPENVLFVVKGFLTCGRADCAVFAYDSSNCLPTRQLVMGMMHGLGRSAPLATRILSDIFAASCCYRDSRIQALKPIDKESQLELKLETSPFSLRSCKTFLVTLLESCAVLGNIEGFESILGMRATDSDVSCHDEIDIKEGDVPIGSVHSLTSLLLQSLIESKDCDFIAASLMAAAANGNAATAHDYLHLWQSPSCQYIPPYLFLHGMVAESFAQTVTVVSQIAAVSRMQSLPFRGFARFGAVRHLDKRRGFLRKTIPNCPHDKGMYLRMYVFLDCNVT